MKEHESIMKILSKYNQIERESREIKINKIQAAKKEYYEKTSGGEEYKKELLERLAPLIEEYINGDACCDCQRTYADRTELIDNGVWLRFDADHPNDIIDMNVSFEELLSINLAP